MLIIMMIITKQYWYKVLLMRAINIMKAEVIKTNADFIIKTIIMPK